VLLLLLLLLRPSTILLLQHPVISSHHSIQAWAMVTLSESKGARVFGRVALVTGLIVVAIHYNQHQERQVGALDRVKHSNSCGA
jgi:hypothetical protein